MASASSLSERSPIPEPPNAAFRGQDEPGSPEIACSHCGLPVPTRLVKSGAREHFCCSGCETVFELLKSSGLSDYYAFRERLGEDGRPVPDAPATSHEFDTPAYQRLYCSELPGGKMQTEFLLEGVHCAACVWLVERLPRVAPSVSESRLNLGRGAVTLTWDPGQAPLSQVARTLQSLGYRPRPVRGMEAERLRRDELRGLLIRIGIAGASAGNVMLMAFALYSGQVGLDESGTMNAETTRFFEVLSAVVSIPALLAASLFFRGAWSALRTRTAHMDLPIAIGILVAFAWGTLEVWGGRGQIYFDSITVLIFLLLIGRYLQRRHQFSAGDAAELLHAVVPGEATVLRGSEDARVLVPSEEVLAGDRVLVSSGQVVPVDGVVVTGRSCLDRSLLSGESRPVTVNVGDHCEAGALNLESELIVLAEQSGTQTRVARLMKEVEGALSSKTRLMGQADRIAGIFTITVLGLAVLVGGFWSMKSGSAGVEHALALLIVACPCALGMATPLALSAAVHRAARARKLVFAPEALEHLARPMDVVLDKTGTLTFGSLSVVGWHGDAAILPFVLAAERHSSHPVGRALVRYLQVELKEDGGDVSRLVVTEHLGRGLLAQTSQGQLRVGSPRFVLETAKVPGHLASACDERADALTPVFVSLGEQVRAIFHLEDVLRPDAAESLLALKKRGHRLHLLSGDHPSTAAYTAKKLESLASVSLFTSVRGGVTPEQKLAQIRELKSGKSAVAMVGDGVNDAGALAAADVGIAVTGAAEASRMSADVYLADAGVVELLRLFEGSERTLRTIRRGLAFSLLYNAVGIGAAAFGVIGPLFAAVLMPLSSLTVVTNAYRSRTF